MVECVDITVILFFYFFRLHIDITVNDSMLSLILVMHPMKTIFFSHLIVWVCADKYVLHHCIMLCAIKCLQLALFKVAQASNSSFSI